MFTIPLFFINVKCINHSEPKLRVCPKKTRKIKVKKIILLFIDKVTILLKKKKKQSQNAGFCIPGIYFLKFSGGGPHNLPPPGVGHPPRRSSTHPAACGCLATYSRTGLVKNFILQPCRQPWILSQCLPLYIRNAFSE